MAIKFPTVPTIINTAEPYRNNKAVRVSCQKATELDDVAWFESVVKCTIVDADEEEEVFDELFTVIELEDEIRLETP